MLLDHTAWSILGIKDYGKLILWIPQVMLQTIQLWPKQEAIGKRKFLLIASAALLSFYGFGIVHESLTKSNGYDDKITDIINVVITFQTILKIAFLSLKSKQIKLILEIILKEFWPFDLLGKKLAQELKNIYGKVMLLIIFIISWAVIYILFLFIKSWINKEYPLPISYPSSFEKEPKYYAILYFGQIVMIPYVMACMILGCDFLFVAISSCIICQYKILHNTFLKFNTPEMSEVNEKLRFLADDKLDFNYKNENKEAFVRCVRHHQLLLSVTKKWNNLFGWIAMCLITSAIIAVCGEAYILANMKNATLSQQVMRLALTIIVLSQLLEYCAIGNELYYQAGLLPEHIFQANWYDLHSCELKKDFMFLLHHSQNVPYLNAYNLYNIDMNFYIKVLKLMFSIYTFFSKMEFKNE